MGWTSVIPASTPRHSCVNTPSFLRHPHVIPAPSPRHSCEGRNPQGDTEVYAPTFEHHSRIMVRPSDFLERCDKSEILERMLCYIMAHAIYDVE